MRAKKENYNFHTISARLADDGFSCLRLTDDWKGADFIACHVDGQTFLKVQLKGRLSLRRAYLGKGLHIAFLRDEVVFLYPHDAFFAFLQGRSEFNASSQSRAQKGDYHWPTPPSWVLEWLSDYRIE